MSRSERNFGSAARRLVALALQAALFAVCAAAQSSDPEQPTPALTGEITGRIAPLDVGDSRRTRHFYAFGAQQGDLELTVEAGNLEGEVDLFAAGSLRPLTKVTLYSGLGSSVSRTVFLRRAESLVLRVQARTPNDAEGSYRIRLGGTFVPAVASGAAATELPAESAAASPARAISGRRVTSTGARIEEPRPEPTPTPAVAASEDAAPEATPEPSATPSRRPARGRAGARRAGANRTTREAERSRQETAARDESTATTPAVEPSPSPTSEEAAPPRQARTPRGRAARGRTGTTTTRRGAQPSADAAPNAATTEPAAPTGLEVPGTRLVLELREGGRVEREMSEVRRVTVERGQIVILFRNGQIERQPLANVLRMSIEP